MVTQPNVLELGLDWATLAWSAVLAVVSAVLCGIAPAFRTASATLPNALKQGAYGTGGPGQQRLRSALMVGQVAMALVLLVAAGLLVRTFQRLQHVDVGFNPDRVLTMTVSLPDYRYGDAAGRRRFFTEADGRGRAYPRSPGRGVRERPAFQHLQPRDAVSRRRIAAPRTRPGARDRLPRGHARLPRRAGDPGPARPRVRRPRS